MNLAELQAAYEVGSYKSLATSSHAKQVMCGSVAVSIAVEPPAVLAERAGVDSETYSLARVIGSEGYSRRAPPSGRASAAVAIGQSVRNEAARRKLTLTRLLTFSSCEAATGHYGEQRGRYAATSRDPSLWHVEVAKSIMREEVPDLALGATKFFDPESQNAGMQAGKKLSFNGAGIIRKWIAEGYAWIGPIPAVDSYALMLFRREPDPNARGETLAAALAVNDARAPKGFPSAFASSHVVTAGAGSALVAVLSLATYWLMARRLKRGARWS